MPAYFDLLKYTSRTSLVLEERPQLEELPFLSKESVTIFSFRAPGESCRRSTRIRTRKVDASERLSASSVKHVVLAYLQKDSPLYPLLFWDIFHSADVGTRFTVIEEGESTFWEREYYNDCLVIDRRDTSHGLLIFTKTAPGLVERLSGLEGWTFGIPTGPGDATGLNACVGRILELRGGGEIDIVICGQPGDNFLYWDKVRIISDPAAGGRLNLPLKKNALALSARQPNLCILHDRVILPTDFFAAMQEHGDHFPFATLPSLFFFDRNQFSATRYSDYNSLHLFNDRPFLAPSRYGVVDGAWSPFDSETVASLSRSCRFSYLPLYDYIVNTYVTGSLYICKTALWHLCPQNERLCWEQLEDVEHGIRAISAYGIPNRIIPLTYCQTLFPRSGMIPPDGISFTNGNLARVEPKQSPFIGKTRHAKPLLRLTEPEMKIRMRTFAEKYLPEPMLPILYAMITDTRINSLARFDLIKTLLLKVEARKISTPEQFFTDFERLLLHETLEISDRQHMLARWKLFSSTEPIGRRLMTNWTMNTQYSYLKRSGRLAMQHPAQFFPRRGLMTIFGSLLFSLHAYLFRRREIALRGSLLRTWRAVLASRPDIRHISKGQ